MRFSNLCLAWDEIENATTAAETVTETIESLTNLKRLIVRVLCDVNMDLGTAVSGNWLLIQGLIFLDKLLDCRSAIYFLLLRLTTQEVFELEYFNLYFISLKLCSHWRAYKWFSMSCLSG